VHLQLSGFYTGALLFDPAFSFFPFFAVAISDVDIISSAFDTELRKTSWGS
jgi:hypothetical protein